jgi:CubicO group peptidase (beta-lactamase class C family)
MWALGNNLMKKLILVFVVISGLITSCVQADTVPTPDPAIISRIDELITGYTEEGEFSGSMLIAEKGFVVLAKGYGFADYERETPNTPHTQFSVQSVTKLFTCAVIRMEADRGLLTQDDTLAKYIPDYPRGDEITISQLLNHTSGIADLNNDLVYGNPSYMHDPISIQELIERFKYEPLEFDPGTKYDYSNSGYALLAYIIKQASEMSYNEYIEKEIFTPLEMSDSVVDWDKAFSNLALGYYSPGGSNTPTKYPEVHHSHLVGMGNIFSTVEDLYLWYQTLHGDEAWKPYDCGSAFGRGNGYSAAFIPIHGLDIVVIMLSNFLDAPLDRMVFDVQEILLEDDLIELNSGILDSYIGDYQALLSDGRETTIRILRVGSHLNVIDIGSNLLGFSSLYPLSPERFIQKTSSGYGPTFDFRRDDSDKISQMIIDDALVIELTLIE